MPTVDVVEVPVPGFRTYRQQPLPGQQRMVFVDPLDHPGVAGADGMGVGDRDGHREFADFVDPVHAGHLTVAIEAVTACCTWLSDLIPATRQDRRHAGPDRAPSRREGAVAFDQGGVADLHAGYIGDGVERAGGAPQVDAEVAGAGAVRSHLLFFLVDLAGWLSTSGCVHMGMSWQAVAMVAKL